MTNFPFYKQLDSMDCGPTCLRMVAKYYGKDINTEDLRRRSGLSRQGVSLLGLSEASESIGFESKGVKLSFQELVSEVPLPCILHWSQYHFVVLVPGANRKKLCIADPAVGLITLSKQEFCERWISTKNPNGEVYGVALLLSPTHQFYEQNEGKQNLTTNWNFITRFLNKYKQFFFQVFLALLLGSLIQLFFPFLTQSIVDIGIGTRDIQFVTVILIAQLTLFFGRTILDFTRSRVLLHVSTRININILSEFWIKLMRLPISHFDVRSSGDILHRIGDHQRIDSFLTHDAINTFFSIISLFVFSIVLAIYSPVIFFVFLGGTTMYLMWIRFFLKFRRKLDYSRFALASHESSITLQLVNGMQEIKLNNAEHFRRWEWESIRSKLFSLSFKSLSVSQYQEAGALFINEGKNIIITFLVTRLVIEGQLTLGAMMAIQYIIGQLNGPVNQLIGFVQSAQDAKISMERLNEIQQLEDEENDTLNLVSRLPEEKTISVKCLGFSYPGAGNEPVLRDINFQIPQGKVIAIVGTSGSGKTTLLKLLLRFYENYEGGIYVGKRTTIDGTSEIDLKAISPRFWRSRCGAVMQDGYIFSDSIAKNIAPSEEAPDWARLTRACEVANIAEFIESLPLGFYTQIGSSGAGISQGQRQRILIARAVYKNPEYVFFDEATNSMDAINERTIMRNLRQFFKGKTVVIVAHRLSTVREADNIIVLHKGRIVESGTHEQLVQKEGEYFELVRNQLELGN